MLGSDLQLHLAALPLARLEHVREAKGKAARPKNQELSKRTVPTYLMSSLVTIVLGAARLAVGAP